MRLLQRTIRLYSILSLCVLLIGIPVFYILLQTVVTHEVDEQLLISKSYLIERLGSSSESTELIKNNFPDHSIVFDAWNKRRVNFADSFYTTSRYDSVVSETIPLRNLKTLVTVDHKPYLVTMTASMVDHIDLIQTVLAVQLVLLALLFGGLWMINKNVSSAYLLQKEFTENAAHEMQTPLAVFQSKLELLMQTLPLDDVQADLIGKMADASQRMNKLNKALILLTRIQNHQFTDSEKVNVGNVVDNLLDQYEDAISQKHIAVTVERSSIIKTYADKTLIEVLIGNLLSNAIRHNVEQGTIRIALNERELVIKNSGPPRALNAIDIVKRFHKDSSDQRSLGLGLEIIDKICTLNRYALKYYYSAGMHSFAIRF